MAKVKILATLGPATDGKIRRLIKAGINGVRLNMSHGTTEENARRIREVRACSKDVFVVVDTLGPKIRLGDFTERKIVKDDVVILSTAGKREREKDDIPVQYKNLHKYVREGNKILIEDGLVGLRVYMVEEKRIICRVLYGDAIRSRKGVNIPNVSIPFPYTTKKDEENIAFAIKHTVDYIADSFERSSADVRALRRRLAGTDIKIISKIENFEGVTNIDEIIDAADGVMVARGDLGVEMPIEKLPSIQKEVIRKCNERGKPVITATQMLDSMIRNPRPTRAEASDVFNAVVDGSDCVMLSGETSIGHFPVEAVAVMRAIVEEATQFVPLGTFPYDGGEVDIMTHSIAEAAQNPHVKAVIIPTLTGITAQLIARFRIKKPVYVLSPDPQLLRQLAIMWGLHILPLKFLKRGDIVEASLKSVAKLKHLKRNDMVIVTAGIKSSGTHRTNMMQVRKLT